VYILMSCPTGYTKMSNQVEADQQRCAACDVGTECSRRVCDSCSSCPAGKYKDSPGTHAWRDCPPNSYKSEACRCGMRFYLADPEVSDATISCANCPVGLECRMNHAPFNRLWMLTVLFAEMGVDQ
jgi:hypothetical protein